MNVTVEHLAACKKLLRFEVDAAAVDKAIEEVAATYQRQAQLPGFRRGKAPRHLIIRTFNQEIEAEARRKLISDAFHEGVREQNLRPLGQPDIEEIQFGRGQPLQFAATLETAPDFELPDYKSLPVKRELGVVTEDDIERALNVLQEQRVVHNDVARPVQEGDYVVVNYTGTSEGKPLAEIAPAARGIAEKQGYWLLIAKDSFIPGFTEQLIGAEAGQTRAVRVTFPSDFVSPDLANRPGDYQVEVVQVKEKILPEITDEFAVSFGAENVHNLREGVRRDLQNELDFKLKRSVRDQLTRALLERVRCELPESIVTHETRNVVYDIVRENSQRGLSKDDIDKQKNQIFAFANQSAKDRIKAAFILGRIAEKEGIKAEDKEVTQRILLLAQQYQIKPDKLVKQLQDRNGIAEIRDQILTSKVLDFLELHAQIEDVLPSPLT